MAKAYSSLEKDIILVDECLARELQVCVLNIELNSFCIDF